MKFMPVALLAATASAFAPTRLNNNGIHKTQQPHLRLLPNPEIVSLVTDSAFSSSSITTSNFIDSLVSNVAGLVLIAGVGAGVYSTALQEKQQELQKQLEELFDKETADDFAVPVAEEPKVVKEVKEVVTVTIEEPVAEVVGEVVEEMSDIKGEVLATIPATISPPAPPTSEKVLKETEKAIAKVKAKGVEETKEKIAKGFNESILSTPSPEPVVEKEEVAKVEKSPGTKKKIAQGVTLIVAAVGVAVARNVIKAWLGRGMF